MGSMVDSFQLYHHISNLIGVLQAYPQQKNTLEDLQSLIKQLSDKRYRVAVIGEFNRGKSSLINSLLGLEVLPTDILPNTAVINRILFDTEKKIVIHFRDGRLQEGTLDLLSDYATKSDKAHEKVALEISHIDVHYPSVFNANGIELIDTPGLNEDEKMTEATLSVLEHIDTAIIVISALMPLSLSEQSLICKLIEQKDIYHLTFAISFIDKLSDDPEEQDEMIDFIAGRLKTETLDQFRREHDAPALIEKAERILQAPAVYGLSAKQAMQGFIKNDRRLLEVSRFPHFKLELTALLTASQEQDRQLKAKRLISQIHSGFIDWHNQYIAQIDVRLTELQKEYDWAMLFVHSRKKDLTDKLTEMDLVLRRNGISYSQDDIFMCDLPNRFRSAVFSSENTVEVLPSVLRTLLDDYEATIREIISEQEHATTEWLLALLRDNHSVSAVRQLTIAVQQCDTGTFPTLRLTENTLRQLVSVQRQEVFDQFFSAFLMYRREVTDRVSLWRKCLFSAFSTAKSEMEAVSASRGEKIVALTKERQMLISRFPDRKAVVEASAGLLRTL